MTASFVQTAARATRTTWFTAQSCPPGTSADVSRITAVSRRALGQAAFAAGFQDGRRLRPRPGGVARSDRSGQSECAWDARKARLLDRRAALMKLPHFDYEAPKTVPEAVELLAEHLDEASVLAGGQSLIPLLALRLAYPAVLIDINGVTELSGVSVAGGWVAIGAMTREYVAEESGTVADALPLLADALPLIGHEAIRSRGTIGGSLAHADPAGELPAVARALDAEFVLCSRS